METASELPNPQAEDSRFEISGEAAALIRRRGGQVWIWSDLYRRLHATTGPPVLHKLEWSTCTPDDLVVHVHSAILPPKRWVLATADGALMARWEGHNPDLFGRVPLAQPESESEEDPADQTSSPLAHVSRFLVVPALAWVFAVLWALRFFGVTSVGVTRGWLLVGEAALFVVLCVAAAVTWLYEKLAERREDRALESNSYAATPSETAET
jgi:hypothetical protein